LKKQTEFECIECGYHSPKYYGKCPHCNNWNSMTQIISLNRDELKQNKKIEAVKLDEIDKLKIKRTQTNIPEFDRVLGGGIVSDSVILIGGDPGIGKSTLLLETCGLLAKKNNIVLYYSGEESATQIKMRADRLKIQSANISILTMGTLEDLKDSIDKIKPRYLVIDSIQSIRSTRNTSISGSISIMKHITSEIINLAKIQGITVFLIGHITKDGQIAGPKTLEHMVDVVLYFQSEIKSDLRILRTEKNRFGPVDELGIFQMSSQGLTSISDPAQIFLQNENKSASGISVFPAMNGLRSILIEIQALVTESPFVGNPRRISVGFDNYRMSMIISIIEKKLRIPFYKSDVFLNITGGLSLKETHGDLATVSALISSYKNFSLPRDLIMIGEVGLTGEVRPVSFLKNRLTEAKRQGFTNFILSKSQLKNLDKESITISGIENISDLYQTLARFKKE